MDVSHYVFDKWNIGPVGAISTANHNILLLGFWMKAEDERLHPKIAVQKFSAASNKPRYSILKQKIVFNEILLYNVHFK